MQIPILPFRGQKKPWNSIPRINRQHPLARGMLFYGYDTGAGLIIDLINGLKPTLLNSPAPPNKPTALGAGSNYANAGGSWQFPISATINNSLSTSLYSIASAWYLTALPTAGNFAGVFGVNRAASATDDTILLAATASNDMQWSVADINPTPFTGNSVNVFHSFVGANTSATAQSLYFDGKLAATTALTASLSTTTSQPAFNTNSASAGGGNNIVGWVYYGILWNRTVTAAEALLLHQDPYCFLIYPEDDIFALGVGSAFTWSQTSDEQLLIPRGHLIREMIRHD